jgi:hypothetical protein
MKPVATQPLKQSLSSSGNPSQPPKPIKGDISSCRAYASFMARNSKHPSKTLAAIWVRFINWSYLDA